MADANSWVLPVASWIDPREWAGSPPTLRERLLRRAAELAKAAKLSQVRREIGADGKKLDPRKNPRADGANGPVLAPHRPESRSVKWCRAVAGLARGTVTIYWSHGWGRILGYHARGEVPGAPVRNLIGFPPGILGRLKADVRHFWRNLLAGVHHPAARPVLRIAPTPTPTTTPVPQPARPLPREAIDPRHATFRSDAERERYLAAVAAGRTTGPNRGGVAPAASGPFARRK